jgi:hypothetical protein
MLNLVERVARFADIDTRRALGFSPRRLIAPDLDLPFASEQYVEFNEGVSRFIKLRNAQMYVCQNEISWVFGTADFMTSRSYSYRRDGRVSLYALLVMKHSFHPDFNDDGSFKRARSI